MGKKDENKEKPLEKMTAKELREQAISIQGIVGVNGMNKMELISAIKKSKGIAEESTHKGEPVREIKVKMKDMRSKHQAAVEAKDAKMSVIYKKRLVNLKKQTRRAV